MVNEGGAGGRPAGPRLLIAEPERLTVADQIELFRSLVVVAATGRGSPSVLFMQPAPSCSKSSQ
jgi:capsular polysaccharide biosynthesis protein